MASFSDIPFNGTIGITSVAPIRGWTPFWVLRLISSAAFLVILNAASKMALGGPMKVMTVRLWSGSEVVWRSLMLGVSSMTCLIWSIVCWFWPSEKFGMHSRSCCINVQVLVKLTLGFKY